MPKKKDFPKRPNDIDAFASMLAEIDEAVALLRPYYPTASEDELHRRARAACHERHKTGRRPSADGLAFDAAYDAAYAELEAAAHAELEAAVRDGPRPTVGDLAELSKRYAVYVRPA
jgi:hypothetical protein